ncbi:hypothetical protein ASG16_015595 [Brevibacillus sp. Leaf182]|nr:hypothetical protein ASG16_015595 [Brevibacillus sp. Leaf182]
MSTIVWRQTFFKTGGFQSAVVGGKRRHMFSSRLFPHCVRAVSFQTCTCAFGQQLLLRGFFK